jgi:hypothetical protein
VCTHVVSTCVLLWQTMLACECYQIVHCVGSSLVCAGVVCGFKSSASEIAYAASTPQYARARTLINKSFTPMTRPQHCRTHMNYRCWFCRIAMQRVHSHFCQHPAIAKTLSYTNCCWKIDAESCMASLVGDIRSMMSKSVSRWIIVRLLLLLLLLLLLCSHC